MTTDPTNDPGNSADESWTSKAKDLFGIVFNSSDKDKSGEEPLFDELAPLNIPGRDQTKPGLAASKPTEDVIKTGTLKEILMESESQTHTPATQADISETDDGFGASILDDEPISRDEQGTEQDMPAEKLEIKKIEIEQSETVNELNDDIKDDELEDEELNLEDTAEKFEEEDDSREEDPFWDALDDFHWKDAETDNVKPAQAKVEIEKTESNQERKPRPARKSKRQQPSAPPEKETTYLGKGEPDTTEDFRGEYEDDGFGSGLLEDDNAEDDNAEDDYEEVATQNSDNEDDDYEEIIAHVSGDEDENKDDFEAEEFGLIEEEEEDDDETDDAPVDLLQADDDDDGFGVGIAVDASSTVSAAEGSASTAESEVDEEEKPKRKRRRRRRRRRPPREQSDADSQQVEAKEDSEVVSPEAEEVAKEEDTLDEAPPKRRRRRRPRKRKQEPEAAQQEPEAAQQEPEAAQQEPEAAQQEDDFAGDIFAEEDADGDEDQPTERKETRAESPRKPAKTYTDLPTWEEAISYLLKNKKSSGTRRSGSSRESSRSESATSSGDKKRAPRRRRNTKRRPSK